MRRPARFVEFRREVAKRVALWDQDGGYRPQPGVWPATGCT